VGVAGARAVNLQPLRCPLLVSTLHEGTEKPVLGIRIRMFLGLPDPDPLVRGMDPDPAPDPSLFS
jgi:hypothetical protein